MELNESTLSVLKNFSGINSNIVIEEGNVLRTISEAKNILATATLDDISFSKKFGVYDLNQFLGVLGLVDKPNLKFEDDFVIISDTTGRSKVKYFYSDIEMLTTPTKSVTMPEADVTFNLDEDTFNKIKRAAGALDHNELVVSPGGGDSVTLTVTSGEKGATANNFSIDVPGTSTLNKYSFVFNIPNLKMMAGNYEVSISTKLISSFKQANVEYWIALEKSSTYGD